MYSNSKSRRHPQLDSQYLFIPLLMYLKVPFLFNKRARHGKPSLPARPVSWTYDSTSSGGPRCTTCRMSGQLTPIPNATVAQTTHKQESLVKLAMIWFLTVISVQLVNMSTSLYFES